MSLTSHPRVLQKSHIIPITEKEWFNDNAMDQYGNLSGRGGQDVADMPLNILKFRADIHMLWDAMEFTIVPKNNPPAWTVHAMTENREALELYDNVPLHPLDRPAEFLFARFALDIFLKILGFLQTKHSRWLAVPRRDGGMKIRLFTPEECRSLSLHLGPGRGTSPGKSKSRSPSKRLHGEVDAAKDNGLDLRITQQRRRRSSAHAKSLDSAISGLRSAGGSAPTSPQNEGPSLRTNDCWACWIGTVSQHVHDREDVQFAPVPCWRKRGCIHGPDDLDQERQRGRIRRRSGE